MDTDFVIATNCEDFKAALVPTLEAMVASGCTAQQLLDAYKFATQERLLAKRASGRKRQRRYMEKLKQNQRATDASSEKHEQNQHSTDALLTVTDASLTLSDEKHEQNQRSYNATVTPAEKQDPIYLKKDYIKTSLVVKEERKEVSKKERKINSARVENIEEFSIFWRAYPHKVGKGEARKAFGKAIKRSSLEQMLAGVERYVATKPTDRSWCNPSTWLNQDRWEDQPADHQIVAKQQPISPRMQVILNNRRMFDEAARRSTLEPNPFDSHAQTPQLLPLGRPTSEIIPPDRNTGNATIHRWDERNHVPVPREGTG